MGTAQQVGGFWEYDMKITWLSGVGHNRFMGFGGLAYLEGTKVRYIMAIGTKGTVGSESMVQLAYGFGGWNKSTGPKGAWIH